jgi:aryl-alcohol dehydrogenase-like predicted oxidoreductase
MFPTLKHFGVGIIPWSPLARGLLTRPFKGDTTTRGGKDGWVKFIPKALIYLTPSLPSVLLPILKGQVLWK